MKFSIFHERHISHARDQKNVLKLIEGRGGFSTLGIFNHQNPARKSGPAFKIRSKIRPGLQSASKHSVDQILWKFSAALP